MRGGLQSIPKGQFEAADAMGLKYWQSMRLVVLPQALKVSIPGIVNSFIELFKDTSLVAIIGLLDLLNMAQTALHGMERLRHGRLPVRRPAVLDLLLRHVPLQPGSGAAARHRT